MRPRGRRCAAGLPSRCRGVVPEALSGRADRGPGRGLGGDRLGGRHLDRRAHRFGQDPGCVSRGDRPLLSGRRSPGRAPRHRCRLRLALAGADGRREREPAQAAGRDRRGRDRARPRAAEGAGCGSQRRHPSLRALGHVAQSPGDRRDDARVALPPAHLGTGPGDARDGEDGDRRRDPRPRPGQARLAPRLELGAPRPPGRGRPTPGRAGRCGSACRQPSGR